MKALSSVVERFIPSTITEFRARAWARFVVAVSILSAPVWLVFALTGELLSDFPAWWAAVMGILAVLQLGVPFLLRQTGWLYVTILVFGAIAFGGITLAAMIVGGFPFHSLMWALGIPMAVAGQRQFRSLLPIWAGAVIALYLIWYALAVTGHAPTGELSISPTSNIWLQGASLICWFGVMLMISHHTSVVTYELADSRDAYQRALLQAQKLNALGKLAGSIENNFNNALMSIDYSLHLLSEQLGARSADLQVELDDMQQTVTRSKALSKKLERLGQGDAETIELVEVDPAVDALVRTLRRLVGELELRIELAAPGATILCDANQLDQVLVNLVVNARDAMKGSGQIVIATRLVGSEVEIEVRDTGCGIPPEVLAHVFEPFFTTKGPDSGTGLGLWICRSIASGAGGELTASSTVGQGTTMTLRLPLADQHSRPPVRTNVVARPVAPVRMSHARLDTRRWSRIFDRFVDHIDDARLRLWGMVLVLISLASVPIWGLFAAMQIAMFGPITAIGFILIASAVLSLAVPLLIRRTRAVELAAFVLAGIHFVALSAIALVSGGFRVEILIWLTAIPILGAQQREFRYFTPCMSVLVLVQLVVLFVLAVTGVTTLPALSPETFINQQLVVLLALFALLVFGFRAASRVGAHLARERDDYATTLVKSQDFELRGTLASSIAHDLNNILTTLDLGTELLRSEVSTPEATHHLDEMQLATAKIQELSRQLTRFGRTNTVVADAVPDLALTTLDRMLGPIVGSHIKISMQLTAGDIPIRVRNHELDQLIINLALNARDAMPDGGELVITTASTGNAVEITVRDQGIGIPQPALARICDPFFTTSEDRVGLGLWVCREIIREAHGTMTFESVVGQGTTVRMVIPRALARHSERMRRAAIRRSGAIASEASSVEAAPDQPPQASSSTRIRRAT